ncbi:hypothetical protein GCM10027167_71500 [Nocardia heshunensis]
MLSPLAMLAATLCLMISLAEMSLEDRSLIGQDGRSVYLERDSSYTISGDAVAGDHITCAFDPLSGKLGFDRSFTVPVQQSWQRPTRSRIGTFAVSDGGTYTITCQSRSSAVGPVQIAPPNPRWLRSVEICGSSLGLFGVLWIAYVFVRRRRGRSVVVGAISDIMDAFRPAVSRP